MGISGHFCGNFFGEFCGNPKGILGIFSVSFEGIFVDLAAILWELLGILWGIC